ncbi:MAG: hypothetical protein CM15mP12_1210 [Gammaproteobacteria bacterium]|nr:MAG: hypothetical protein CM15mP12_1210 [Gammaproteobacteria bacterium]
MERDLLLGAETLDISSKEIIFESGNLNIALIPGLNCFFKSFGVSLGNKLWGF